MANRALLYASDDEGFPCAGDRLLRGRNYAIPLLWLASADLEAIRLEEDPEEPGEGAEFTCLCVEVKHAQQLLWRRRAALEKLAGNLDEFVSTWTDFLDDLPERYLKFEISEVLYMHEAGDHLLRSALQAFDEASETHVTALFNLIDLGAHYDVEARVLCTPRAKTVGQLMAEFGGEPAAGNADTILRPEPVDEAILGYPVESETGYSDHSDAESCSTRPAQATTASRRCWPLSLALTIGTSALVGLYLIYITDGSPRGLALGGTSLFVGLAFATRSAVSLPAYIVGCLVFGLDAIFAGLVPWGAVVLLAGIPGARSMLCEARGEARAEE